MGNRSVLVILTPGFPASESDSTCLPPLQCFVRSVNRIFPELELIIISTQYPYRKGWYDWHGNKIVSMNGRGLPIARRLMLWIKIYQILRRTKKNAFLLGILSFWCLEEAMIGQFFSRRNRTNHKIWINGQDARSTNPFVKWINPKAENLVAMSEFLAGEFFRNFSVHPKSIVPNAVDPAEFKTESQPKIIDILGVGSLITLKQYDVFIDVVKNLKDKGLTVRAVLCGDGPEVKSLREKSWSYGLESELEFAGELPHGEILDLMQQSRVLLHPSSYEGYSTVCLEALFCGCHVVSFVGAEKRPIDHWHIVMTTEEMTNTCLTILEHESDFTSVLVHRMKDSAKQMVELFGYPSLPA